MLLLLIALNFFSSSLGSITQSKPKIRCSDDGTVFFTEDDDKVGFSCSIYCTSEVSYKYCNQCCNILEQRSSQPAHNTFTTSTDYRK